MIGSVFAWFDVIIDKCMWVSEIMGTITWNSMYEECGAMSLMNLDICVLNQSVFG